MPERANVPGYTHIEDAPQRWPGPNDSRKRNWWYDRVKWGVAAGGLTGYEIPGLRGTWLRDEEVEAYLAPKPKISGATADSERAG